MYKKIVTAGMLVLVGLCCIGCNKSDNKIKTSDKPISSVQSFDEVKDNIQYEKEVINMQEYCYYDDDFAVHGILTENVKVDDQLTLVNENGTKTVTIQKILVDDKLVDAANKDNEAFIILDSSVTVNDYKDLDSHLVSVSSKDDIKKIK